MNPDCVSLFKTNKALAKAEGKVYDPIESEAGRQRDRDTLAWIKAKDSEAQKD